MIILYATSEAYGVNVLFQKLFNQRDNVDISVEMEYGKFVPRCSKGLQNLK